MKISKKGLKATAKFIGIAIIVMVISGILGTLVIWTIKTYQERAYFIIMGSLFFIIIVAGAIATYRSEK